MRRARNPRPAALLTRSVAAARGGPLHRPLDPHAAPGVVFDWSIVRCGPAERYLHLLALAASSLDAALENLDAAVRANAQMGAAPFLAYAEHERALALAARGVRGDAVRAAALLVELAAQQQEVARSACSRAAAMRREGEYWTITYEGRQLRLKDAKGLHHLARLLQNPGRELHVVDLGGELRSTAGGRGLAGREGLHADRGDAGPALDGAAKRAYRQRLDDLRADVEEAEAMHDPERAERARGEIDFLVAELRRAVGLGGRDVREASTAERARQSVRRSLKSVLEKIRQADPELGAHLAATVRTGYFCSYTPDPRAPLRWEVASI